MTAPAKSAAYTRKTADDRKDDLIAAAIACLAQHGAGGFTIDNICRIAGVSRGLISHHFGGKDELLAAAYAQMIGHVGRWRVGERLRAGEAPGDILAGVIDYNFSPAALERSELKAWLAIYGEIGSSPRLLAIHRAGYERYHGDLVMAIDAAACARGVTLDAGPLATSLIALIDGLWLQLGLDASRISPEDARRSCRDLLSAVLGERSP